jgi:hypothetical protein
MPLFKLTKPVKKLMKKNQDENRATIREDARKPKNVSKPKAKLRALKKPTMMDVAGNSPPISMAKQKEMYNRTLERGNPKRKGLRKASRKGNPK